MEMCIELEDDGMQIRHFDRLKAYATGGTKFTVFGFSWHPEDGGGRMTVGNCHYRQAGSLSYWVGTKFAVLGFHA